MLHTTKIWFKYTCIVISSSMPLGNGNEELTNSTAKKLTDTCIQNFS